MLASYHQLFIIICMMLLIISIFLVFMVRERPAIIAALMIIGINIVICEINWLGFFGIHFIGYSGGEFELYAYPNMWHLYVFFFILFIVNIILAISCWLNWQKEVWKESGIDQTQGNYWS